MRLPVLQGSRFRRPAIFGRTGDGKALEYGDRISEQHLGDVRAVLAFMKTQGSVPVWIVGTSAGTVSATATAIKSRVL